jgi:hypothetical protein
LAVLHLLFRLAFVIVDGVVHHYYGILGDFIIALCITGLIFGYIKEMPTFYWIYLIFAVTIFNIIGL